MRDIALVLVFAWALIQVFRQVHHGVYLWTWFSLMNPHKLAWGFATTFPFATIIALATFVSLFINKAPKQKVWHPETVTILLLTLWVTLTTFVFAFYPDNAIREWERFVKIQLFIFLTILLITDKKKLNGLVWVMALSIGFFGFKGGVFTVLTGGGARVWGPEGSFIGGNNELALALLMTVPMLRYLFLQESRVWIKRALLVGILLCMISIVGTQSRGALLGIIAIGVFLAMKSRNKVGISVVLLISAITIAALMPDSWWERMNTIRTYQEDASAMSRLNAWGLAWNVATDTIVGGGANLTSVQTYRIYAPFPFDKPYDFHSIYFEILGEQGFPGLFLFLLLGWLFWRRCSRLVKQYRSDSERRWAADLGAMLQVSFIGYAVSGAFLGLAYFDYYYTLIATAVIASMVAEKAVAAPEPQTGESSGHVASDSDRLGNRPGNERPKSGQSGAGYGQRSKNDSNSYANR